MLNNLKRNILTCGMSEEDFLSIKPDINEDNSEKLTTVSFVSGMVWLVMLVISFMSAPIADNRIIYAVGGIFSFIIYSATRYLWKKESATVGMYIFAAVILLLGMIISVAKSPGENAVTYIVMFLACPLLFTDRPARTMGFLWLFYVIFVGALFFVKTGEILETDIINATVYTAIASVTGTYVQTARAKRMFYENKMEYLGCTDDLTGLASRGVYSSLKDYYQENGIKDRLVVLYLDVNGLKEVNDGQGHHMGNKLLQDAADCIKSVFGAECTCCRIGGDEFVVIGELERKRLEALLKDFEAAQKKCRDEVNKDLNISVGYAFAGDVAGRDFEEITRKADEMLYVNKEAYYLAKGIDRGGVKNAYEALCDMYDKIIMLDLGTGLYREVKKDTGVETGEKLFEGWVDDLEKEGDIIKEDAGKVKDNLSLVSLKEKFLEGEKNICVTFRQETDNGVVFSEIEVVPDDEYSPDNQTVFLYVKDAE